MKNENFAEEISPPTEPHKHVLRITKAGLRLLVSFRVTASEIPPWLPRRYPKESVGEASHVNGKQVRFRVNNAECDLHSVKLDLSAFSDLHLANAYWNLVETQKGKRSMIYFWFHDTEENVNPDSRLREQSLGLFGQLSNETWDYMDTYINPNGSLAIVLKGGSAKPVRHSLSIFLK